MWIVESVDRSAGTAAITREDATRTVQTHHVSLDDLVVVAEFRDPIYPGFVSTGTVERGGDKPFHSVINAENFHAPNVCMPSAGWETLAASEVRLDASAAGAEALPIRRLLLQQGAERMLIYYWFQSGDRLASSEWALRGYRLLDLLRGQELTPTVIVSVYIQVEEDAEAADAAGQRFLATLAPHLRAATCSGGIHG